VEWIVRCVRFHGMRSREDLFPAEPTIESFLTDLEVNGHVAAVTQHQAMHAPVFLYTRVLHHAMEGRINAVRADKKLNVPVVMTRDEVAAVISLLDGTAQLVATLLYGSGLRIMEAVRIRVKDIDVQMTPLTVRSGTGDKDRFTTVLVTLTPLLQNHLARVKTWHQQGCGSGTWRGLPAPSAGSDVSACRQGMGLAVCLSRPGHLCRPSFRCHPSPSRGPQRHQ
jgi:site-specific recombinase XerD